MNTLIVLFRFGIIKKPAKLAVGLHSILSDRKQYVDFIHRPESYQLHEELFSLQAHHTQTFHLNLSAYLVHILKKNKSLQTADLLRLFELASGMQKEHYVNAMNRMSAMLLESQIPVREQLRIINAVGKYNRQRARHYYLRYFDRKIDELNSFEDSMLLLKTIGRLSLPLNDLLDHCLDCLHATNMDKNMYLEALRRLAATNMKINHHFVENMARQSHTLSTLEQLHVLENISRIEQNLRVDSKYIYELDTFYDSAINCIKQQLDSLDNTAIMKFIHTIKRSGYYDQQLLVMLMERCRGKQAKILLMELSAKMDSFHRQFIDFLDQLLQNQEQLTQADATKILWSLCVLLPRQEIMPYVPYLTKYAATNKSVDMFLTIGKPQKQERSPTISKTQKQLYDEIERLGIPCIEQLSIQHLCCDVCIPDLGRYAQAYGQKPKVLKNIVIEMHGFQHFFRNSPKLNGSSKLKKKLVESRGYRYYYVVLDEWELAYDKQQFLRQFLKLIHQA